MVRLYSLDMRDGRLLERITKQVESAEAKAQENSDKEVSEREGRVQEETK